MFSKDEIEQLRQEEMRELLLDQFDEKSVLFDMYKKRNWLDRLFTQKILSMDKEALYLSTQVAEICEISDYTVKNKRRALLEYINPTVMGEGNSKIYKHNYISVFKIKMIDGLTGEGSDFTLPQLKDFIYGSSSKPVTSKNVEAERELLLQVLNRMDKFEKFSEMIESNEFFEQIKKTAQESVQQFMLGSSKDQEVKDDVIRLYEKIISADTTISEKELLLDELSNLEKNNPEQIYTIKMYRSAAEEKINRYKQDERELFIRNLKHEVHELIVKYDNVTDDKEREQIKDQLQKLGDNNIDLNFEIRLWLSTLSKDKKKKGFFGRLFS